ncbi:MAG: biotin/lipoyl-containing protein, partial [Thermocrispum sp.]
MAFSVTLPELGESVTEGTVTRWLKQEGDSVAVDEPLLEISTDKVDTEVPSPVAGVVSRIVAKEDDTVEVGGELAVIDDGPGGSGGDSGDGGQQQAPAQEAPAQEAPAEEAPAQQEAPAQEAPAQQEEQEEQEEPQREGGSASGTTVTLPELGESVTEGTVTRWLKQVGDTVSIDEPLLEISTDKVDTEVPSPVAGTVLEISAAEDETVPVGGRLAVIGTPAGGAAAPASGDPVPAGQPAQQETPAQEAPAQQETAQQETPAQEAPAQQETAQQEPASRHAAPDAQAAGESAQS